ncbi:hypothetical protein CC1G_12260 [Coprinopsis cinerea okayama7|uniref:Fungal N-terminal domain-containing protein n=1 Tax=Coprinopsis cinerea (strain Okayama-7 / 130 / ATCC MYA-4618 / FGSC 9003) TaxID=240176 RepID=A8NSV7_COPC7|nr:hypothetical protein CC1G_12260 [Coprinopsis cinerea okayama7\|eukprot:XP_001836101.2 hypothetical protein CC1G_12260 [Coprinopsis cinerea okayama7\
MDIPGLVLSVFGVARGIHSLIDELKSKKEKLRQLQWRVKTLVETLQPLITSAPDSSSSSSPMISDLLFDSLSPHGISDMFLELAEILGNIRERIALVKDKDRSKFGKIMEFVNPSVLLGRLEDDEKRLSRWIELFALRIQIRTVAGPSRQNSRMDPDATLAPTDDKGEGPAIKRVGTSEAGVAEASRFWEICFGELDAAEPNEFFVALKGWVRESLDDCDCASMALTIDPEGLGIIPRRNLMQTLGSGSVVGFAKKIKSNPRGNAFSNLDGSEQGERRQRNQEEELKPTIVWVDDRAEMVETETEHARSLGIRVILLPSTFAAKFWIRENEVGGSRTHTAGQSY